MRRLNRELCWRVKWSRAGPPPPSSNTAAAPGTDSYTEEGQGTSSTVTETASAPELENRKDGYRKDANHVLLCDGEEGLKERVGDAEPSPIVGLYRFNSYLDEILSQYHNVSVWLCGCAYAQFR
jgi:hypothetical protein